jgi:hypothetical protein
MKLWKRGRAVKKRKGGLHSQSAEGLARERGTAKVTYVTAAGQLLQVRTIRLERQGNT